MAGSRKSGDRSFTYTVLLALINALLGRIVVWLLRVFLRPFGDDQTKDCTSPLLEVMHEKPDVALEYTS
jgi:hypothetical protein